MTSPTTLLQFVGAFGPPPEGVSVRTDIDGNRVTICFDVSVPSHAAWAYNVEYQVDNTNNPNWELWMQPGFRGDK